MKVYVVVRVSEEGNVNLAAFFTPELAREYILKCYSGYDYAIDEFEIDEVIK